MDRVESTRTHLARKMREAAKLPRDLSVLDQVGAPALLMVGAVTSAQLRGSTQATATALPHATVVELPGHGHGALDRAPHLVAEAIRASTAPH